jgi:adenylosuccinate synthase
VGVFKAYSTRVGRGPLPTELTGEAGALIRERGREYGTTTGRPRRCGWFDGVAGRYAVAVNGLDTIALMLFDVLDVFDEIPVCVGYRWKDMDITEFPAEPWVLAEAQPVYEVLPGWRTDTSAARKTEDLPRNARRYVDRIADLVGCEVGLVSVGADREQTVLPAGSRFREWLAPGRAETTSL